MMEPLVLHDAHEEPFIWNKSEDTPSILFLFIIFIWTNDSREILRNNFGTLISKSGYIF